MSSNGYRRDTDTDDGRGDGASCATCLDADPQVRHQHFLAMAQELDFGAIEAHFWQAMRTGTKLTPEKMRGYVDDRMQWLKGQMAMYSNVADPATGAKLPWWEGRRLLYAQMRTQVAPVPPPKPVLQVVRRAEPPVGTDFPDEPVYVYSPDDVTAMHDYTPEPEER